MKNPNKQPVMTLRPEILIAMRLLDFLYTSRGEELTVTWTTGGKHKPYSVHPKHRAFDSRKPSFNPDVALDAAREIMGPDFDFVEEVDHIHTEWDPK